VPREEEIPEEAGIEEIKPHAEPLIIPSRHRVFEQPNPTVVEKFGLTNETMTFYEAREHVDEPLI